MYNSLVSIEKMYRQFCELEKLVSAQLEELAQAHDQFMDAFIENHFPTRNKNDVYELLHDCFSLDLDEQAALAFIAKNAKERLVMSIEPDGLKIGE